jgi:hypothetical protein
MTNGPTNADRNDTQNHQGGSELGRNHGKQWKTGIDLTRQIDWLQCLFPELRSVEVGRLQTRC